MNRALKYGAVLIGTYLLVVHFSGAGEVLRSGGGEAVALTKALQGR